MVDLMDVLVNSFGVLVGMVFVFILLCDLLVCLCG